MAEQIAMSMPNVNADKNSLMKQFALGVKVGRTKKLFCDQYWSKRIVLKLFGVYAGIICFARWSVVNLCKTFQTTYASQSHT